MHSSHSPAGNGKALLPVCKQISGILPGDLMLPARGRAGGGFVLCQVDIGGFVTRLAGSCVEHSQWKLFLTNELLSHRWF